MSRQKKKPKQCRKRSLKTREQAEEYLTWVKSKNYARNDHKKNEGFRIYRCPYCGDFHIGHRKNR